MSQANWIISPGMAENKTYWKSRLKSIFVPSVAACFGDKSATLWVLLMVQKSGKLTSTIIYKGFCTSQATHSSISFRECSTRCPALWHNLFLHFAVAWQRHRSSHVSWGIGAERLPTTVSVPDMEHGNTRRWSDFRLIPLISSGNQSLCNFRNSNILASYSLKLHASGILGGLTSLKYLYQIPPLPQWIYKHLSN